MKTPCWWGPAALRVTVDAASSQQFQGNIHQVGLIPIDTVILIGLIVPLSINLSQSLDLESALSARTSTRHGSGGIDVKGEILAEYNNGWHINAFTGEIKQNLAGMVTGISVGINSIVFAIDQRLLVGVAPSVSRLVFPSILFLRLPRLRGLRLAPRFCRGPPFVLREPSRCCLALASATACLEWLPQSSAPSWAGSAPSLSRPPERSLLCQKARHSSTTETRYLTDVWLLARLANQKENQ